MRRYPRPAGRGRQLQFMERLREPPCPARLARGGRIRLRAARLRGEHRRGLLEGAGSRDADHPSTPTKRRHATSVKPAKTFRNVVRGGVADRQRESSATKPRVKKTNSAGSTSRGSQ